MSATPSTWDDVVAAADGLPGVDVSTWYGTPGLKVGGKGFARMRDQDGSLVLLCELAEKEALLACGDDAFHTTPHYDGYGSILVRLDRVDPEQLRELVRQALVPPRPGKTPEGGRVSTLTRPPAAPKHGSDTGKFDQVVCWSGLSQ